METKQILMIIAGVIMLVLAIYLAVYFSPKRRKGRAAERKVYRLLKKLSKKKHAKILNNVYLPLYKGTCQIDHLVFGSFGILVIETKGISGTVSGKGKQLTHTVGNQTYKFYNPQMQNQTHIDNVAYHLKKGGYKGVPVKGAVVFTDKDIVLKSSVGMNLKELEKFYMNLKSTGCNPEILYDYFKEISVNNPLRKIFHVINVSRKQR